MIKLALLGYPLGHSLSPALHACVLEQLQLEGKYEPVETPAGQLGAALQRLSRDGYRGCNVTIPHKQEIMALLDDIDPAAELIGAVNTVRIEGMRCSGFNTDGVGFMRALDANSVALSGANVILLGAGGGARSVAFSLARSTVNTIQIFNRHQERARQLALDVQKGTGFSGIEAFGWPPPKFVGSSTIVVNATPVGMWPESNRTPLSFDGSGASLCAVDLVYNPLRTRFLESAQAAGAATVDGLDMLIYQGIEALGIWLQRQIECDRTKLREFLIQELNHHAKA